jgi:hypothetical protein
MASNMSDFLLKYNTTYRKFHKLFPEHETVFLASVSTTVYCNLRTGYTAVEAFFSEHLCVAYSNLMTYGVSTVCEFYLKLLKLPTGDKPDKIKLSGLPSTRQRYLASCDSIAPHCAVPRVCLLEILLNLVQTLF